MNEIITVNNLSKKFGGKSIFHNLSFALPAGGIIGLLGENGIGKTTLLRMIAGFLKPDRGSIMINGQLASRGARSMVSYLFEPDDFYPFMNVKNALQFYKDFYPDFNYEKALKLCSEYKLDLPDPIRILSKGNKERLCLLLTLSRRVPLYLLDEPVAGFDPRFKRDLIKTILSNIDEGATLIISSHLLRDLEGIFDMVAILMKNKILITESDSIRAQNKSIEDYYLEVAENA